MLRFSFQIYWKVNEKSTEFKCINLRCLRYWVVCFLALRKNMNHQMCHYVERFRALTIMHDISFWSNQQALIINCWDVNMLHWLMTQILKRFVVRINSVLDLLTQFATTSFLLFWKIHDFAITSIYEDTIHNYIGWCRRPDNLSIKILSILCSSRIDSTQHNAAKTWKKR